MAVFIHGGNIQSLYKRKFFPGTGGRSQWRGFEPPESGIRIFLFSLDFLPHEALLILDLLTQL
jgi:hypothetical protein